MDFPFCAVADAPQAASSGSASSAAILSAVASAATSKHFWVLVATVTLTIPIHAWAQQHSARRRVPNPRPSAPLRLSTPTRPRRLANVHDDTGPEPVSAKPHASSSSAVTPSGSRTAASTPDGMSPTDAQDEELAFGTVDISDSTVVLNQDDETTASLRQKRSRNRYKRGPNPLKERSLRARQRVASWTTTNSDKSAKHAVTDLDLDLPLLSPPPSSEASSSSMPQRSKHTKEKRARGGEGSQSGGSVVGEQFTVADAGLWADPEQDCMDPDQDCLSETSSSIPSSTIETPASSFGDPNIPVVSIQVVPEIHDYNSHNSHLSTEENMVSEVYQQINPILSKALSRSPTNVHHAPSPRHRRVPSSSTSSSSSPPSAHPGDKTLQGRSSAPPPSDGSSPIALQTQVGTLNPEGDVRLRKLLLQIASLTGALSASRTREEHLSSENQRLREDYKLLHQQYLQEQESWCRQRDMYVRSVDMTAYYPSHHLQSPFHVQPPPIPVNYGYYSMVTPQAYHRISSTSSRMGMEPPSDGEGYFDSLERSPVVEAILKRPLSSLSRGLKTPVNESHQEDTSNENSTTSNNKIGMQDADSEKSLPPSHEVELVFPSIATAP
jgi:hypothetical protein